MEENKLSTNLEQINVSVSEMRDTLDMRTASLEALTDRVGEVKSSLDELENNMVYQVSSHSEMYDLANVAEGSTCLVNGTTIRGINETDTFNTIYYPDTVVLPAEPVYHYSFSFNIADTGHGAIEGTLSGIYFDFMMIIKGLGSYGKNIDYDAIYDESQNAYIFTRQDIYGTPVISAGELSWNTNYPFDPVISQFIQIEAPLQETYIYQNGNWVFVSTDLANVVAGHEETIYRQNQEIETLNARIAELEQNGGTSPRNPSEFVFRCFDQDTQEFLTGDYHVEIQLTDPSTGIEYKRVSASWHPFSDMFFTNTEYNIQAVYINGPEYYIKPAEPVHICTEESVTYVDLYFQKVATHSVTVTLVDDTTDEVLSPDRYWCDYAVYDADTGAYINNYYLPVGEPWSNVPEGNLRVMINTIYDYGNHFNKYATPHEFTLTVGDSDVQETVRLGYRTSGSLRIWLYDPTDGATINLEDKYEYNLSIFRLENENWVSHVDVISPAYSTEFELGGFSFGTYLIRLDEIRTLQDGVEDYIPLWTEATVDVSLDNIIGSVPFGVGRPGSSLTVSVRNNHDWSTLVDTSQYEVVTFARNDSTGEEWTMTGNPVVYTELSLGSYSVGIRSITPLAPEYPEYVVEDGAWGIEMIGTNREMELPAYLRPTDEPTSPDEEPDLATASYGLGESMALYNASLSANTVYGLKGYNQAPIPEGSLSCITSIHSYGAPLMQLQTGYADLLGDLSTDASTILYGFKADKVRDKIRILNQDTGVFETIDSDIVIYAVNTDAVDFNSIAESCYRDDDDNVYFKSLIDTAVDHFSPEIPSFVLESGINMLYTTVEL